MHALRRGGVFARGLSARGGLSRGMSGWGVSDQGGVWPGGCLARGCLPGGCLPRVEGCLPRGWGGGGCVYPIAGSNDVILVEICKKKKTRMHSSRRTVCCSGHQWGLPRGCFPGGCLPRGCLYSTPPPREQNDWLTGVKTLPCPKPRLWTVIIHKLNGFLTNFSYEKEYIPVGCVPSAAVAVCWGLSSQGGGGVVCPGGCLPSGGVYPVGYLPDTPPPPWTEWQTLVKTLPCGNCVADGKKLVDVISC